MRLTLILATLLSTSAAADVRGVSPHAIASSHLEDRSLSRRYFLPPGLLALLPAGWDYIFGCVADGWQQGLSTISFKWPQNTPANCAWACQLQNYEIAATTNGDTCICSHQFGNALNMRLNDSTQCGTACPGDSRFTCGGTTTHQLFYNPRLPIKQFSTFSDEGPFYHVSLPCASAPGTIVESGPVTTSSTNTPQNCASSCVNANSQLYPMQIVAVVNGNQCQCGGLTVDNGNFIAGYKNYQVPSVLPQGVCSTKCTGSTTQFPTLSDDCGGPSAATIYSANYYPSSFASVAPLSWPWDTLTCADIGETGEIFANPLVVTSPLNTPGWCTNYCANAGYVLAGVELGNRCLCANSYAKLPFTDDPISCYDAFDAADGNPPCAGNSSLHCGGFGTRHVFHNLGPSPTASSSILPNLPPSWTVLAWCADSQGAPSSIVNGARTFNLGTQNSPTYCSQYCYNNGYQMAIVQDAQQCICGASRGHWPSYADAWDCNTPCASGTATCGGSFTQRNSLGSPVVQFRVQIYGNKAQAPW